VESLALKLGYVGFTQILMRSIFQFFRPKAGAAKAGAPDESLPLPTLSKAEQFALLEADLLQAQNSHQLRDLITRHFGDEHRETYRLFSISKEEYLAWACTLPVSVFADTEPGLRDGRYLLERSGSWIVMDQERGYAWREVSFPTQEDALDYLYKEISPYGIYPHLRDEGSGNQHECEPACRTAFSTDSLNGS
jgi:hypothetical protein